jgi:hypothetical protein
MGQDQERNPVNGMGLMYMMVFFVGINFTAMII